jgi:hypothetical protein
MAKTRIGLQLFLENLIGSRNVYFQPPPSFQLKYPCIIYNLADINNTHANNSAYIQDKMYTLTVIDSNPDSEISDKVSKIPMCSFDRFYTSDNLNHFVYTLFY